MTEAQLAHLVMRRCDELGTISDESDRLTRTFASPAMRRANELVGSWMREAGMTVFLNIPKLQPTWCMEIKLNLRGADGTLFSRTVHNTIHELGSVTID